MTAATNAQQPNHTIGDALLYAAALAWETAPRTTDEIMGHPDLPEAVAKEIEHATEEIDNLAEQLSELARIHNLPDSYSDGRPLWTTVELGPNYSYSQLWHPDPRKDVPHTFYPAVHHGRRVKVDVLPPSTVTVEVIGTIAAVPDPED